MKCAEKLCMFPPYAWLGLVIILVS